MRRKSELQARIDELAALVEKCDPAIIAQYREMHAVSMEYYELLDKLDGATSDNLFAIKDRLDELSAPFSDNQAFVALLERKRMIAESKPPGPHRVVSEAMWSQTQDRVTELKAENAKHRQSAEFWKVAADEMDTRNARLIAVLHHRATRRRGHRVALNRPSECP